MLETVRAAIQRSPKMPALFIGHGSPLNALEDNAFSRVWAEQGRNLPRPQAVLCLSAHWQTQGTWLTAMPQPRTIHDFYGFPRALFDFNYPAPGSPSLAGQIQAEIPSIRLDQDWGFDHGCWSILCHLFPAADIPVLQLSLDLNKSPEQHYQLGRALRWLRDEGVLIVGSGNIVHNLQALVWEDRCHAWASSFAEHIKHLVATRNHAALLQFESLKQAQQAIPTAEHFLPLLYVLGLQDDDVVTFLTDKTTLGAISMLSIRLG